MLYTNSFDTYDMDEDLFDEEYSSGYTFDNFKRDYPAYLGNLNISIERLYKTYILVHNRRFSKLEQIPECFEIANRCGFGMLMRHALETISTSIATECGVEVGGRSVFERLSALKGQNIPGYDEKRKAILFKLLDLTNEIAHPHVGSSQITSFDELTDFYSKEFDEVLAAHISHLEVLTSESKDRDFGIPKEIAKSRRLSYRYLLTLKSQLDSFNISNKITGILTQGCLVRQLTECSANLWCYNYNIVPTDASTFENQINLGKVLDSLSKISRINKRNAFGTSALTPEVVSRLFDLKSASNSLMHVEKFATGNLSKLGKELSKLHKAVKSECSPHVMKMKLSEAANIGGIKKPKEKSPLLTSLLCGIGGWLGLHHFYTGNIAKGVFYLIFRGFIIGPVMDLNKIRRGRFRTGKGLRLKKTSLTSILSLIFILLQLLTIYHQVTTFDKDASINKILDSKPIKAILLEKLDEVPYETLTEAIPAASESSSNLISLNENFDISMCLDKNSATCWQEDEPGNGIGETLTFKFSEPETISAISILNGKQSSEKSFAENARARMMAVRLGKNLYLMNLEDIRDKQTFKLPKSVETTEIRFVILSAYPGNVWEDLAISEVEFHKETLQGEAQK